MWLADFKWIPPKGKIDKKNGKIKIGNLCTLIYLYIYLFIYLFYLFLYLIVHSFISIKNGNWFVQP